jgi:hypothetical protein
LLANLHAFEVQEEVRTLGDEELLRKAEIVTKLERTILMEEVSWRRTLEFCGSQRGTRTLSSSTKWQIPTEEEHNRFFGD